MKVKMKISGGFRTNDGADIFATLRSVVSTARKQRWNTLQALMTHGDNLVAHVRA
jgi:transposase